MDGGPALNHVKFLALFDLIFFYLSLVVLNFAIYFYYLLTSRITIILDIIERLLFLHL